MIRASGYKLIVKPDPMEKTVNGIIVELDDTKARHRINTGTVLSIGPTAWMAYDYWKPDGTRNPHWEPWCKVGDKVYYAMHSAKWIGAGTEDEVVVLNDQDVIGPKKEKSDE